MWSYTSTFFPTPAFLRWWWPEGCRRKVQPAVQDILRCWQAPNTELTDNVWTKKRGPFTFTPYAPWDEWSRTTRIAVPRPPAPLPAQRDSCRIIQNRFSMLKVVIHIVIKIQTYIFFFFNRDLYQNLPFPQGTLWNKVPCADRNQCIPRLYSWKMHVQFVIASSTTGVKKYFTNKSNAATFIHGKRSLRDSCSWRKKIRLFSPLLFF